MSKPAFLRRPNQRLCAQTSLPTSHKGVFSADDTPDPEWFEEPYQRFKRVMTLAKRNANRELPRCVSDSDPRGLRPIPRWRPVGRSGLSLPAPTHREERASAD